MANDAMMKLVARMQKLFDGITEAGSDMGSVSEALFAGQPSEDKPTDWMYGYREDTPRKVINPEGAMDDPVTAQLMSKLSMPVVGFLETEIDRLRTQLRASEAHNRRYAVACGKYRSACLLVSGAVEAVRHGGDLPSSVAESLDKAMWIDIDAADALIDPVATEVVS